MNEGRNDEKTMKRRTNDLIRIFWAVLLIGSFLLISFSQAETMMFIGGRKIDCEILSYQNNEYEVKTSRGIIKVHKNLIYSIVINPLTDMTDIDTPKKAFQRWITAAKTGDADLISRTYAAALMQLKKQELLKIDSSMVKKMSKIVKEAEFNLSEPVYFGDRATMQVERIYQKQSQISFIEFIFETGQWKLNQQ